MCFKHECYVSKKVDFLHFYNKLTLDVFAASAKAAIVFPMGIGISMILFSLYSFIVIKEKATTYHITGIIIATIGIIFFH
jgi:uncharacterized membrane protein